MAYGEIRNWAEALPIAELFTLDDVQRAFPNKSREAAKMAMSRLCEGDDPLVARAFRGLFCRRRTGLSRPVMIPFEAKRELPWRIAGRGAGLTGPDIINGVGWSTQVSPKRWIAVVGRPPQFNDEGIVFKGRSNEGRRALSRQEASLLEAARCFDEWAEMTWPDAMDKYADDRARGAAGPPIRGDLLVEVAAGERGLGPTFRNRCSDIAAIAGTGTALAA